MKFMIIETLEGPAKLSVGDTLIKGIKGEFYPVAKEVFEKIYEVESHEEEDLSDPEVILLIAGLPSREPRLNPVYLHQDKRGFTEPFFYRYYLERWLQCES